MKGLIVSCLFLTGSLAFAQSRYGEVKQFIQDLASQYSQNAQVISIGKSDQGEDILALKVGDGEIHNLVVATHHGNEYGSTEVAKAFAAAIAQKPLKDQTIFVIPVLNISGYNKNRRLESGGGGELHDPNRDYPGACGSDGPFELRSTKALDAFLQTEHIVNTATLHTHSPAVTYPWGMSTRDRTPPSLEIFKKLARWATKESHYTIGTSADIVYPADGTYEDYVFQQYGIFSLLFEMGTTHTPSPTEVEDMIRVNVPGLRAMFEGAPTERAEEHDFKGECETHLRSRDRRDE